jgi:hypothetical protein
VSRYVEVDAQDPTCLLHHGGAGLGQVEVGRDRAPPPSYSELKRGDGARIFARMLYEGMQE